MFCQLPFHEHVLDNGMKRSYMLVHVYAMTHHFELVFWIGESQLLTVYPTNTHTIIISEVIHISSKYFLYIHRVASLTLTEAYCSQGQGTSKLRLANSHQFCGRLRLLP